MAAFHILALFSISRSSSCRLASIRFIFLACDFIVIPYFFIKSYSLMIKL